MFQLSAKKNGLRYAILEEEASNVTTVTLTWLVDRRLPECSRCVRIKEKCEGYAPTHFVVFEPKIISLPGPVLIPVPVPVPTPGPSILNEDLFITYTRHYLWEGSGEYFKVLSMDYHSTFLYRGAITALSTSYFGLRHGRPEIVRSGNRLYGNLLVEVNRALNQPSKDLLAAVVCLGVFEVCFSVQRVSSFYFLTANR